MKILVFDIEVSPIVAYTWGLYETSISPDNIIRDREVLCIAWKWVGENKVYGAAVGPEVSERDVLARFYEAVEQADVAVAYNGDKYDWKHLTAKLIEYRLPPWRKLNPVDPLKEIKRVAKFSSHRLDWLCGRLFSRRKLPTDMQLWKDCMALNEVALARMLRYCKQDVKLLERLYLETRPYYKGHPNIADFDSLNCPRCNSASVSLNKEYRTKAGLLRNHMRCNDCRSPFTMRGTSKSPKPLSVA